MSGAEGSLVELEVTESVLEEVTVLEGGAEVRRRLSLPDLKPGPVHLSLLGLVDGAKDLQLHVLKGPASLRLLSLPTAKEPESNDPEDWDQESNDSAEESQEAASPEDQLLKDQVADLDARLEVLRKRQGKYEQVKNKVMGGWLENYEPDDEARPEKGVEEAFKAFDRADRVYEDAAGPIKVEATALAKEKAELVKQLAESKKAREKQLAESKKAREKQLAESKKARKKLKKEAERKAQLRQRAVTASLDVTGEGPQAVVLGLTYQVAKAGWTPFYVLREKSGSEKGLRLTFLAEVSQLSGEEWRGAKLLLSSARADRFADHERPAPFAIETKRPFRVHQCKKKKELRAPLIYENITLGKPADGDDVEEPQAARPVARASSEEGEKLITRFELLDKPLIPSSESTRHQVVVAELELDAEVGWDTTPEASTSIFRTAKATNTASYRLPAGPVSVYCDSAFVSKTRLKAVRVGESFSMSLGEDVFLGLERKVPETTESTDPAAKTQSERNVQRMVVWNGRKEEVVLRLQEPIPRSQSATVAVRVESPKVGEGGAGETDAVTGDRAWLDEDHVLHWHVRLQPKASRNLCIDFTITGPLPKKKPDSADE